MKLFNIFKPKTITRKPFTPLQRNFEAAAKDRFTSAWSGDFGITANDIRNQLPTIRNRVRECAKNDAYIQKALQMYKANIIGHAGIRFVCDYDNGDVNASNKIADKVEAAFRQWAQTPEYCDAEGRKTLTEFLWQTVENWMREGEAVIIMIPNGSHADNPFRFSLKMMRPDALCVDYCEEQTREGTQILNGVEVDSWGRPIRYHFYKQMTPTGIWYGDRFSVDASRVLHLFVENYEGQTRGIPIFAPVIRSLKMSHAYDEAELVAARIDASRNGTYKMTEAVDPNEIADLDDGGFFQQLEPGEDRICPKGWDYVANTPSRPNSGYGQFHKDVLRQVAAGISLSYNKLCGDLDGVSYSSIRSAELEDRQAYSMWQSLIVDRILRPMFRRQNGWLDCAFLARRFDFDAATLEKIRLADSFICRRWEWVDPLTEVNANVIAVEHGWKTDSQVAAEMGEDYWNNSKTKEQEKEWNGEENNNGNEQ